MSVAVLQVYPGGTHLNTETGVAHLGDQFRDFVPVVGKRRPLVLGQQAGVDVPGQAVVGAGRVHHPAGQIGFRKRAPAHPVDRP